MSGNVVVLTGGVGGAKLVEGLQAIVPAEHLTAIVNTGDDFRHLGLHVSPDIDSLLYALSGKANLVQGWGREGETWSFMAAVRELGGEDWFALGDHDLALHVLRSLRLARGEGLASITQDFARNWGLGLTVLPMSEQRVATYVTSGDEELEFQRYFVERRCEPEVNAIRFDGAEQAEPAPGVVEAISAAQAIIIAPSNPFLSVDPLLAVEGLREALDNASAPIIAVSPIVDGKAVKGPTAKLMAELGLAVSNETIARHYDGLIDGLLIHDGDEAPEGIVTARTNTLMKSAEDKARVAQAALDLAQELSRA